MRTLVIVPVKSLTHAKSRLARSLPAESRRQLVTQMLEDVLAVAVSLGPLARILVITPDAEVAALAKAGGADVLSEDKPHDLNSAVRRGLAHAGALGFERALIIPADVPLATAAELRAVLDAAGACQRPQAVLVPARDGGGTNAMLLSPPDVLQPAFGPGSFVRHVAEAVARGLDLRVLRLSGLGADIDEPGDLAMLMAAKRGSGRYAFLETALSAAQERREGET